MEVMARRLRNLVKISSVACLFLYWSQLISAVGQDDDVCDVPQRQHRELRTLTLGTKRQGAPFRIAMFADLHFGEDAWTDWGPGQDANSTRVMSAVLDAESAGDVIDARVLQ